MNYLDRIKKEKIIPVIKIDNAEDTLAVMDALSKGGINIAEITFRTAAAPEAIKIASAHSDMLVGAGTVINIEQAQKAVECGAKFLVSPGFDLEVAEYAKSIDMLYIAGCVTPTEIMAAINCGISIIKFFPAEIFGGLNTIKNLAAVFPNIYFVPTGGINQKNIAEYLSFEKIIACGGSWMVKDSLILAGDYKEIERLSKEAKESII